MAKNKFGLAESSLQKIIEIFRSEKSIQKAVIYGSRAKGNYRTGSDIDITLFGENLTIKDLLQIENKLDDLLLPETIDLSIYETIENPDLISHIRRVGIVFYEQSDVVCQNN